MKIEKLPSGSYRIRKHYKGKRYTVIVDYKPTQKEALKLISDKLESNQTKSKHRTFEDAAKSYIESKLNILSPSTIRVYYNTLDNISDEFKLSLFNDLSQFDIQKEINRLSESRAPKTVRNYHGFISGVFAMFRPDMNIHTMLPQKRKNEPYIPTDSDIKTILSLAEGTMFEVALLLACYGLRRSEICALTLDDIDGDVISINKAIVLDQNKEWVLKSTKTTESERQIVVSNTIIQKIHEQGFVYKGNPNSLTDWLTRTQKKNNIPHFSLHKFRHYFASKMSEMNIPEADILSMGGWKTDYIMKGVYRHAMNKDNLTAKRNASDKLVNAILS